MTSDNRKSFLELRIIWKDDDMFELKVTASNIDFDFRKELVHLAKTEEGCAILYGNDNRIDN